VSGDKDFENTVILETVNNFKRYLYSPSNNANAAQNPPSETNMLWQLSSQKQAQSVVNLLTALIASMQFD